jgi:hypothetical protein
MVSLPGWGPQVQTKATECCALCLMPLFVNKEGIPMQKVQPRQPPLTRSGQGSKPPAHALRKNVRSTVHYDNLQVKPAHMLVQTPCA